MYIYIYTLLLLIFDQKYVLKYLDFLFPNRLCLADSRQASAGFGVLVAGRGRESEAKEHSIEETN